jgi:hypothetical protein
LGKGPAPNIVDDNVIRGICSDAPPSLTVPDWRRSWPTSVVLPWSTGRHVKGQIQQTTWLSISHRPCAMIAILRIRSVGSNSPSSKEPESETSAWRRVHVIEKDRSLCACKTLPQDRRKKGSILQLACSRMKNLSNLVEKVYIVYLHKLH